MRFSVANGRLLRKLALILAVLAAAISIPSGEASATAQGTLYVSRFGDDVNNDCLSLFTPCRTFAGTANKVGSVLVCLDPGDSGTLTGTAEGYGIYTVTTEMTIDCALGGGAVTAPRIIINAPGKAVRLQNMILNYSNLGDMIEIVAAAAVHIENVRVSGSINRCLNDHRTGPGKLTIVDSIFRDCSMVGILVLPAGGSNLDVALDNVRSYHSAYGLAAGNGSRVAITRSVFSGNTAVGVEGDAGSKITLDNSLISSNAVAIQSSSIYLSNNDISFNATTFSGSPFTFGNNRISGNSSPGSTPINAGSATSSVGQK